MTDCFYHRHQWKPYRHVPMVARCPVCGRRMAHYDDYWELDDGTPIRCTGCDEYMCGQCSVKEWQNDRGAFVDYDEHHESTWKTTGGGCTIIQNLGKFGCCVVFGLFLAFLAFLAGKPQ